LLNEMYKAVGLMLILYTEVSVPARGRRYGMDESNGSQFGAWLRRWREYHGYSVTWLSQVSGVDASTISRLENNRTQCTMLTAVRLGDKLRFSWEHLRIQFVPSAGEKLDGPDDSRVVRNPTVLLSADVIAFVDFCQTHSADGLAFLTQTLNTVMNNRPSLSRSSQHSTLPDNASFLWDYSDIFHFRLYYPPTTNTALVHDGFRYGGAVISDDIMMFLDVIRQELPLRGNYPPETYTLLRRLETTAVERVKLEDVVRLDAIAGDLVPLLHVYWSTCQLLHEVSSIPAWREMRVAPDAEMSEQHRQLVHNLFALYRWSQFLGLDLQGWLDELRQLPRSGRRY